MKRQIFKFKPFSKKQRMTLNWWTDNSPVKDYNGIIADGAIRSGKTISMSLSFAIWAMNSFNGQNFAMCGKTIGSFRRNVLFWLKLMLLSRGYSITDHRADNLLTIRKDGKENYFYIFGGKDERSQDLIQGITLTIIQEAMSPWEHGVDYQDVQKIYDAWIEEGNSQLELFQKVLIPLMVVSGFLPEKMAANLMEDIENI